MDAMLQTLIARLREKIEPDRAHPRYVITVRGEGYQFIGPKHQ
jgi:DNA-binding response OmpR family regulator